MQRAACPGEDVFAAWFDGTLASAERADFAAHLDTCVDCRLVFAELSRFAPAVDDTLPASPTGEDHPPAIGRFVVERIVGQGGMGTVFLARDSDLDRPVAIKVVKSGGRNDRLLEEARSQAQINHPNVVRVYEVGRGGGGLYIAMELIAGETLRDWLRQPRTWREVVGAFVAAGRGLVAAHRAGLVHRDFKPANVLVGTDGRIAVTDFGLARSGPQVDRTTLARAPTQTGAIVGTPAYLAPEQWRGDRATELSDQFAFAIGLYEGLYGARPFAGDDTDTILDNIVAGRVIEPPDTSEVPDWLHAIVLRALSAEPEARYPSMEDLLRAIEAGLVEPRTRSRRIVVAVALAIVAFGCGAVWYATRDGDGGPNRGGSLRLAIEMPDTRFDVYSREASRQREALRLVIEPLLHAGRDGEVEPWVIERSELRDGGRQVVLHLRDGVVFHDHPCFPGGRGRAATTSDVAFSIRQAKRFEWLTLPVERIVETDARVMTLALAEPSPFYETELSAVALIPRDLDGCEDLRDMKQPVGSGPFRFAQAPHGVRIELQRAPRYWLRAADGAELPYLDTVIVQGFDNMSEVMTRMARGELEVAVPYVDNPAVIDREALKSNAGALGLDVATHTTRDIGRMIGLMVGARRGPLSDRRVRVAIAHALDRAALHSIGPPRLGNPAGRYLSPTMHGYDSSLPELGHDLGKARALLREVGPIPPITIGSSGYLPLARAFAKQLAEVGIEVRTSAIPGGTTVSALTGDAVDGVVGEWQWEMYAGEAPHIVSLYSVVNTSEVLTGLQRELTATITRPDRGPIYQRIERSLLAELPFVPIAWGDTNRPWQVFVVRRNVHGFHDRVTGHTTLQDVVRAWLVERS